MTIPLMETGNSGSDTNFLHIGRELEEIKFKLAEMDNGLQRALIEQAGILKRLSNFETKISVLETKVQLLELK